MVLENFISISLLGTQGEKRRGLCCYCSAGTLKSQVVLPKIEIEFLHALPASRMQFYAKANEHYGTNSLVDSGDTH